MRLVTLFLLSLLGTVGLSGQGSALTASEGRVRLPAAGESTTIAVAWVENTGMYATYLVSASSDVAEKIEFRDASKKDALVEQVTVPPNETAYLDPKGIYMHLSGLKRPLMEGDEVSITLTTELGAKVGVSATVKKE